LIENPYQDGQNYYAVKKYHYTRARSRSIISWGSPSNNEVYSWGVADDNKNIIIPLSKEHESPVFYKAYGISHENSVDSLNIMAIKWYSIPTYKANGEPFDASKYFKNNTYIYDNIITRPISKSHNKNHFLVNLGTKTLTIPGEDLIWWYDQNIIIVGKRETTTLETSLKTIYQFDFIYGAYSVTGDILIPFNKTSKEEVKQLLDEGYLSQMKIRSFFKEEFDRKIINFDENLAERNPYEIKDKIRLTIQIDVDGSVSLVAVNTENKTILREVKRVIGKLPLLKPAMLNGKPVSTKYSFLLHYDYETQNMSANNLLDENGKINSNSLKQLAYLNTINIPVANKLTELRKQLDSKNEYYNNQYMNTAIYLMNPKQGKKELRLFLEKEIQGIETLNHNYSNLEMVMKNFTIDLCKADDISILIRYLITNEESYANSINLLEIIYEVSPKHYEKVLAVLKERNSESLKWAEEIKEWMNKSK